MTPVLPYELDSDITSAVSSGESDGNSEYVDFPKTAPTSSANTLELEGHIIELQQMHEVAEENIDDINQPTELFTHTKNLNPTELANYGTTLT